MTASARPNMPSRIGKYRIERELGRGATSIVYLGHDAFFRRPVAIKLADTAQITDARRASRLRHFLQTEAALVGRLKHPHIVALLDAEIDAEQPYVVMEYIEGDSLDANTRPDTLLPVDEVLELMFQCCGALEYALQLGLIHRDIKPANMLRAAGGGLKLTDFGTAHTFTSDRTQIAGLVGSPAYMSPEQIREDKLSAQSDMFSLGVVMYQLLTGALPFDADNDFAIIYKINYEQPQPPSLRRPALGRALDAIVARALAKNPQERYASWREFADAIASVCQALTPSQSTPPSSRLFRMLRETEFLAAFPDTAIWEVMNLGRPFRVSARKVFMREMATGSSFYVLLEGEVLITRNGREIARITPGQTIGEMIYLNPNPPLRIASATALTELTVFKIPCASLRSASEQLQGAFDKAFIGLLVDRLAHASRKLATMDDQVFIQLG